MGGEVRVQPALISPDVHFLRQLVIAGQGIAFLPDGMLPDPGIDPELIVPVLPDVVRETVSLRVVVPEVLAKSPRVRAILESIDAIVE
jgi:DNA-binding transcriptional LysR family regulator